VAVLAAVAGVAAGVLLVRGTATAGAAPGSTGSAPAGGGAGLPVLPGLSGNGDGRLRIMLTGRVLAVSAKSITIGGNGPAVTAAITGATEITGKAGGIRVGDEVSAKITGTGSDLTATAIQDPAVS
jgi:hypothetical protein